MGSADRVPPGRHAAARQVSVRRVGDDSHGESLDVVAVESPLQVVVDHEPYAVIMRTPGDDEALVAGFLHAEGIVSAWRQIAGIDIERRADGRDTLSVRLGAGARPPAQAERRRTEVNASCGMCGRVRVESLTIDRDPLIADWTVEASLVASLPDRLRAEQRVFDETGGLHAAALFALDGSLLTVAEDVGRHNAVDKTVGRLLRDGRLPAARAMLAVSGRVAYEIVQKAVLAGVPLVAAVSAPSSLAVALADRAGVTLAGFVRGGRFTIYAHAERIREPV